MPTPKATSHRFAPVPHRLLVGLVALCTIVAACSANSTQGDPSATKPELPEAAAVDRFARMLASGADVDYTPLLSPDAAVKAADLVVLGRIVSVSEGLTVSTKGEQGAVALWMATMRVSVDEVIAGKGVGDAEIVIQTFTDPTMDLEALQRSVPNGPVLFILDDITGWRPFADAVFAYPADLGPDSTIFMPFTDGVWFNTTDGLQGVAVSAAEIAQRWPGADTFPGLAGLLRDAAKAQPGG